MPMYRHTQPGYVTLGVAGAVVLRLIATAVRQPRPIVWGVIGVLLLVAWLFSSLTIEVGEGELRSHFGPGFWRRRVPLDDIADVAPSRTSWIEGWGIRLTLRGMLYNVSGTRAVEVRLRSGKRFRLGTDEPEVLLQVIRSSIGGGRG